LKIISRGGFYSFDACLRLFGLARVARAVFLGEMVGTLMTIFIDHAKITLEAATQLEPDRSVQPIIRAGANQK
jgi:hypothetical protein